VQAPTFTTGILGGYATRWQANHLHVEPLSTSSPAHSTKATISWPTCEVTGRFEGAFAAGPTMCRGEDVPDLTSARARILTERSKTTQSLPTGNGHQCFRDELHRWVNELIDKQPDIASADRLAESRRRVSAP